MKNFDNKMYCDGCIMYGIANKNYVERPDSNSYLGQQSKSENIKVCYWVMSKMCKGWGQNMFPYFRWYLLCGGGIYCFCSTTKYTPFMIYLQIWLICNRHCSTQYNKLLCVGVGEGYCELIVNFVDFLFIVHAILLFQESEAFRFIEAFEFKSWPDT